MRCFHLPLIACLSLYVASSQAQQVYRCEFNGQVSYAHEPCLGAQAIDTTPTQGLNKSTGRVERHPDVQREIFRHQMAEAMRPITVLSPETHQRLSQRYRLPRSIQLECAVWDTRLPGLEQDVTTASDAQKAKAEVTLFRARQAFRDLRC